MKLFLFYYFVNWKYTTEGSVKVLRVNNSPEIFLMCFFPRQLKVEAEQLNDVSFDVEVNAGSTCNTDESVNMYKARGHCKSFEDKAYNLLSC